MLHNVVITNNVTDVQNIQEPFINYSNASINQYENWIVPHTLLFQDNVQPQQVQCSTWNNLTVFFITNGQVPFDVFAASFYLLSRYEEYLPHQLDSYQRYAHTNSIAYQNNFLHLPLIELWMQALQQQFNWPIQQQNFTFLPTYDIDIAYAIQHHHQLKNVAAFFKQFLRSNWDGVSEYLGVLSGAKNDPFNVYNWLDSLHQKHGLQPIYFFLLAEKRLGYDKNLSPSSPAMQKLIQQHGQKYTVGIHPSWQSGDHSPLLTQEIALLQKNIAQPVTHSRQHYIRMSLPATYQQLIASGIQNDYSMGYGSINGFRASYSKPHIWYNLATNQATNLTIHPFCYMEANSFFEQKMTIQQAAQELQQYHAVIKQVSGTLSTIFHNHFITQQPQWIAWRNMYAQFIENNF